ncbi:MAG: nucleotide-binding protein [Bacteroidia bacterium]|nr:nucleotide-binding protein [Bacteroidia bacterium]
MNPTPQTVLPVVFIGSSREGKPIADLLQVLLDEVADVIIWDQGVFSPMGYTLDSLLAQTREVDFAIFIITPDDHTASPGQATPAPRDNVIFEAGLFMGVLGRERTILIKPRYPAALKLPTDFLGVTYITYKSQAFTPETALGAAANRIRTYITKLGPRRESSLFDQDPDDERVLELEYAIRIFNENGDAELRQSIKVVSKGHPIQKRKHTVFSHTGPMEWEMIKLKAWDEKGRSLQTQLLQNDPNRKEFEVRFRNGVRTTPLTYHYSCRWDNMFPPESSYLILKSKAKALRFVLILPATFDLLFVEATALRNENQHDALIINQTEEPTAVGEGYLQYKYSLEEYLSYPADIKFQWSWKREEEE